MNTAATAVAVIMALTVAAAIPEFEDYDTNQDGAIDFQEFVATRRGKEDKLTNVDDDWEEAELEDVGQSVTMYFMRHAEGCHNPSDAGEAGHKGPWVRGAWKDPPLTKHGMAQARLAAPTVKRILESLPENKFSAVLVSPMRRAQQTALLAFQSIPDTQFTVAPEANERVAGAVSQGAATVLGGEQENVPLTIPQQKCLWQKDQSSYPNWAKVGQCQATVTCNAAHTEYSAAAKRYGTQTFAEWALSKYAGKTIFVAGHSNWAARRGLHGPLHGAKNNKVNWASITKVTIKSKSEWSQIQIMYEGTPKTSNDATAGATASAKSDESGCPAEIVNKKACTRL